MVPCNPRLAASGLLDGGEAAGGRRGRGRSALDYHVTVQSASSTGCGGGPSSLCPPGLPGRGAAALPGVRQAAVWPLPARLRGRLRVRAPQVMQEHHHHHHASRPERQAMRSASAQGRPGGQPTADYKGLNSCLCTR